MMIGHEAEAALIELMPKFTEAERGIIQESIRHAIWKERRRCWNIAKRLEVENDGSGSPEKRSYAAAYSVVAELILESTETFP